MNISKKFEEKINTLFKDDEVMKNDLLNGDEEAIRKMGVLSQRGISAKDVVYYYEHDDIDNLYEKAKLLIEIEKLYLELCNPHITSSEKKR